VTGGGGGGGGIGGGGGGGGGIFLVFPSKVHLALKERAAPPLQPLKFKGPPRHIQGDIYLVKILTFHCGL